MLDEAMTERDAFVKRYQDGIFHYRQISGVDPTVCVMGYEEFLRFEVLARENCTVVMKETEPEFRKREWLGITIFEGATAMGMAFGK